LGILNEFERRLEGIIEGAFTKAFRTGVHPVELATRIVKDMENGKSVGVREVWVPNRYEFRLSPEDREKFERTEKALRRELEQVVAEAAAERGWSLVGPPEVLFETDEELKQGKYLCVASLVEGPTGGTPAVQAGPVQAGPVQTPSEPPIGELVALEKNRPIKTFPVAKDRVIIGRLADSDVVVPDPGVSRRHAEVRRQDGRFVLIDLGSTNGTLVNGAAVGEHPLEEGDRIKLGNTVLEFRRR
jgi:hypothetical protein